MYLLTIIFDYDSNYNKAGVILLTSSSLAMTPQMRRTMIFSCRHSEHLPPGGRFRRMWIALTAGSPPRYEPFPLSFPFSAHDMRWISVDSVLFRIGNYYEKMKMHNIAVRVASPPPRVT